MKLFEMFGIGKPKHRGGVGGEIEIKVYSATGRLIEHKRCRMDSFVHNMKLLLLAVISGGIWSAKDTAGDNVSVRLKDASVYANEGEDTHGIVVGSSDQAFDIYDYKLISKIPHGTGAGQLSYGVIDTITGEVDTVVITRVFDNYSGGDVVVREIGVINKTYYLYDETPEEHYIMLARDVISATTVPNNGRLSVTYTFKINP